MIRNKHGYRYQSHAFRNPPRGKSGTVTSPGAGADIGLCRVQLPAVVERGRDLAGRQQGPGGTDQDLRRAKQRSLAQTEHQFWQFGHSPLPRIRPGTPASKTMLTHKPVMVTHLLQPRMKRSLEIPRTTLRTTPRTPRSIRSQGYAVKPFPGSYLGSGRSRYVIKTELRTCLLSAL